MKACRVVSLLPCLVTFFCDSIPTCSFILNVISKLVPALFFCRGRTIVNMYISVVVWGMHKQYACAVLI